MAENKNSLFFQLLSMKRRQMSKGNRKRFKKFSPLSWLYPLSLERQYAKTIIKIIQPLITETEAFLANRLESWIRDFRIQNDIRFDEDYSTGIVVAVEYLESVLNKLFAKDAENNPRLLLSRAAFGVSDANKKQWFKFSKKAVGVDVITEELWEKSAVEAWGNTNLNLVKSLSQDYVKRMNLLVSEAVERGGDIKNIESVVKDFLRDSKKLKKSLIDNRAKLIARDQVGKLNGEFTKRRQKEADIDTYIWITAGDERVRAAHKKMNNTLNRWDDNNVYSKDGGKTWISRPSAMQGAIPGSQIQCRCSGIPNIGDLQNQADKIIEQQEKTSF